MASMWRRVDAAAPLASWQVLPAVQAMTMAQLAAADGATAYVSAALALQDADPAAGQVAPASLAGVASDGRPLDTLLMQPALEAEALIAAGAVSRLALLTGAKRLNRIVVTQVADASRVATGVATTGAPGATGYIRMLTPPSCSRCVILAGRWYAAATAFRRHPRCDCVHIPAAENLRSAVTSPQDYFDSLSEAEQNKVFTIAGAHAIRDGADISQVVNARRGGAGLSPAGARLTAEELRILRRERGRLERVNVFGRDLFVTTEGTTVRGTAGVRLSARETGTRRDGSRYRTARAPRLMPESIYEIAENREDAIRLLKRYGYLL